MSAAKVIDIPKLITAEQFIRLDLDQPAELVRGRIVFMGNPRPRHGEICGQIGHLLKLYLAKHRIGRVAMNDSGVKTETDPDTVRCPDVAFYNLKQWPPDTDETVMAPLPPDIAFEVRSPSDRTTQVLHKVYEFLEAGVRIVVIVDPKTRSATVYQPDRDARVLTGKQKLTFPAILKGFAVPVSKLFEIF